MRQHATRLLAIVALGLAAPPAFAQSPFGIEASAAGELATQDLGLADIGAGLGLEATLAYQSMPHLSAYGGWGRYRFPTDGAPVGLNGSAEETGYTVGLQFAHPSGMENADGDIVGDTDHGLRWQAGVGLVVPPSDRVSLTPGIRFRSLSCDIDVNGTTTDMNLRYLSGHIGVAATFQHQISELLRHPLRQFYPVS